MADPVLTATLSGQRAILLSWTFGSNADFQVFWKSSSPPGQEYVLLATTNAFSYTTAELDPSKTYDFYIRANVGATYFYSNVVELFVSCGKGVVLSDTPPPPPTKQEGIPIVVVDHNNHRIVKLLALDLSDIFYLGGATFPGLSDFQFNYPSCVCFDGNYLYVTDMYNHRITKRNKSDQMEFVSEIGTEGTGNDQFQYPMGIATDGTYLYICDSDSSYPYDSSRIVKRLASDLSYVSQNNSLGLREPNEIAYGRGNLFVMDSFNNRIVKLLASDLSFVSEVGSLGSGENGFDYPQGIAYWYPFIYITDYRNHRIMKRNSDDAMAYVSEFGTYGAGNDNFNFPYGIATDGLHLFITDPGNARVVKRVLSDYSYVTHVGEPPARPYHQTFNGPMGICIQYLEQEPQTGFRGSIILTADLYFTDTYEEDPPGSDIWVLKRKSNLSWVPTGITGATGINIFVKSSVVPYYIFTTIGPGEVSYLAEHLELIEMLNETVALTFYVQYFNATADTIDSNEDSTGVMF